MDFTRTFEANAKCNNIIHVWSHFYKILVLLKYDICPWANIFDTDIFRRDVKKCHGEENPAEYLRDFATVCKKYFNCWPQVRLFLLPVGRWTHRNQKQIDRRLCWSHPFFDILLCELDPCFCYKFLASHYLLRQSRSTLLFCPLNDWLPFVSPSWC